MNSKSSIFYVASKSGGHLIPCITLARQEKASNPTTTTILVCGTSKLEKTIQTMQEGMDHCYQFVLPNLSLKRWWKIPQFTYHFIVLCIRSFILLGQKKPSKIVSTGGLITIPVAIAALLRAIPLHLYELNATPGKAIKFLAPLAQRIFVCFKEAQSFFPSPKTALTSYPLRDFHRNLTPQQARCILNLDQNRFTIFVMGGSQGSLFINTLWQEWLLKQQTTDLCFQVIHHVGMNTTTSWQSLYNSLGIKAHLFTFTPDMEVCYKAASLVICRSGAGTLFELEACNIPYVTIPLPKRVTTHQIDNARAMQLQSKLATIILQEELESNSYVFHTTLLNHLYAGQSSGF